MAHEAVWITSGFPAVLHPNSSACPEWGLLASAQCCEMQLELAAVGNQDVSAPSVWAWPTSGLVFSPSSLTAANLSPPPTKSHVK